MFENPTTRRVFIQKGPDDARRRRDRADVSDQTVMAIANPFDTPRTQQPTGKDGQDPRSSCSSAAGTTG
jgi:hypothetical protein